MVNIETLNRKIVPEWNLAATSYFMYVTTLISDIKDYGMSFLPRDPLRTRIN